MLDAYMVVVDIETTGLEPELGKVLELGMAKVSTDTFAVVESFHSLVAGDDTLDFINDTWKRDDYAFGMHEKSGLTAELLNLDDESIPLLSPGEVEWRAVSWLRGIGVMPDHTEPMCGSSVHFDRKWLEHHMPRLADGFGYRNIDASSFAEYAKKMNPTLHSAMRGQVDQEVRAELDRGGLILHRTGADIMATCKLFKGLRKHNFIA